jgi:hypothetical protein
MAGSLIAGVAPYTQANAPFAGVPRIGGLFDEENDADL